MVDGTKRTPTTLSRFIHCFSNCVSFLKTNKLASCRIAKPAESVQKISHEHIGHQLKHSEQASKDPSIHTNTNASHTVVNVWRPGHAKCPNCNKHIRMQWPWQTDLSSKSDGHSCNRVCRFLQRICRAHFRSIFRQCVPNSLGVFCHDVRQPCHQRTQEQKIMQALNRSNNQ